jgi:hypothetical protein
LLGAVFRSLRPGIWILCDVDMQEAKMADGTNRDEQAAAEFARRWIAAVQAMGNQIQRQQETFQQMMQESMYCASEDRSRVKNARSLCAI